MAIQLSGDSADAVITAALDALEETGAPFVPADDEELERLIQEGFDSGEAIEANEEFWEKLRAETQQITAEHLARKARA